MTCGITKEIFAKIRLAKIDVKDANGEGGQRGEKSADGGARNRVALGQRAETNCVSGAGECDPVFREFQKIPGDIFGDVIFGLAPLIDFDFDGAGRMRQVALNAADVEATRFEMPECFLTEAVVTDPAGNDAGIAEQRRDVCEIRGSAAELFALREKVPEKFTEADYDGARSLRGRHGSGKNKRSEKRTGLKPGHYKVRRKQNRPTSER